MSSDTPVQLNQEEVKVCIQNSLNSSLRILVDVLQNHVSTCQLIEEHIKAMQERQKEFPDIKRQFSTQRVVMKVEKMPKPQLICTSDKCMNNGPMNAFKQSLYNICKDDCLVPDFSLASYPHSGLTSMDVFHQGNNCNACGCSWETHMQIFYKIKTPTQETKCTDDSISLENLVTSEYSLIASLRDEILMIRKLAAHIVVFLRANRNGPGTGTFHRTSDWFNEYLLYRIKCLKKSIEKTKSGFLAQQLEFIRSEHESFIVELEQKIQFGDEKLRSFSEMQGYFCECIEKSETLKKILPAINKIAEHYYWQPVDNETAFEKFTHNVAQLGTALVLLPFYWNIKL